MKPYILTIFLMSIAACLPAPDEKKGKEKAIETLQRLKAERELEVTVNQNGVRKTMKVKAVPMESPDGKAGEKSKPSLDEAGK